MIYFKGKPRQLKALLQWLLQTWGPGREIRDLPDVVCR
jgi:hypothetical protein